MSTTCLPTGMILLYMTLLLIQLFGPDQADDNFQEASFVDDATHGKSNRPVNVYWCSVPPYTREDDARDILFGANDTDIQGVLMNVVMDALIYCNSNFRHLQPQEYVL